MLLIQETSFGGSMDHLVLNLALEIIFRTIQRLQEELLDIFSVHAAPTP
jgi:hypothetical protein